MTALLRAYSSHSIAQTTLSYLVLVAVSLDPSELPYQTPYLAPSAAERFFPGAGEALPIHSFKLQLEGVIHIEGTVLRWIFSILTVRRLAYCELS